MVENTISNAIMIIAVVIATTVVLNAVYPVVFQATNSMRSATSDADSHSKTAATISSCSFSADYTTLDVWMKNTGRADIEGLGSIRAYYGDGSGGLKGYNITGSQLFATDPLKGYWSPGETYEISISGDAGAPLPHGPGEYTLKIVLPNAAECETTINI